MKEKKRKVGRPKLAKSEVKNVLAIRLSDAERREFEESAAGNGISLSALVRHSLQREKLSKRTYERLHTTIRAIREAGVAVGGKKGDEIYGLADRALAMVNSLVCEIAQETPPRK